MNRQKKVLIALLLIFVTILSGCKKESGKVDFEIGSWEKNVFTNNWLNLKFEIPSDWKIASDEEIAELAGVGSEIYGEATGTNKDIAKAAAELKTIYGFMVSNTEGIFNAQLIYENLALTIGGKEVDEKEYLDIAIDNMMKIDALGYQIVEKGIEKEIGGKAFQGASLMAYEGARYQDYYCFKLDKYMVSCVLTYDKDTESLRDEFLNSITELNK